MDTTNLTLQIEAIEDTVKKVILKTPSGKAYMWKKKQDGTETKAFQQFQQFKFSAGDVVDAAVKEQERTFTNEKGKEITYMDRQIMFFKVQDNTPVATQGQVDPQTPRTSDSGASSEHSVALKAFLEQMQKSIKDLEARIVLLEKRNEESPLWIKDKGKWEIVPLAFE